MHPSPTRRGTSRALLRATPVAAAVAVAAMLLGSNLSHAQPAPPGPKAADQIVTVTGIRRGIESAINVDKKRRRHRRSDFF